MTQGSTPVATAGVSISTAEPSTPPTTTTTFIEDEDLTITQTLMKMRSVKSKENSKKKEYLRLQAELDEEVRFERAREEEASNAALIEEWDSIESRIDADAQLAERLQAEERELMSVEERARLLMEFIAAKKKFFAAKRAEEQRKKPPTKSEQTKKMCIYMKHMAGYKDKNFKAESSRKKAVSKKRAGERPSKESAKRPKIEDDAEKAKLKACLEIVPGDDSAASIESLATKYPIVDWKTHILAEDKMYYQIIRADGSTKYYKIFSAKLDDFDRQDVLDLYRLVKERFESTSPEGYDRLLWGDLITLFEPKKKYPLTQEMLSRMLSRRLEVDHECEMAFELLGFIKSQYKKGGLLGIKGFLTVTTVGSSYNCWLELLLLFKIEEKITSQIDNLDMVSQFDQLNSIAAVAAVLLLVLSLLKYKISSTKVSWKGIMKSMVPMMLLMLNLGMVLKHSPNGLIAWDQRTGQLMELEMFDAYVHPPHIEEKSAQNIPNADIVKLLDTVKVQQVEQNLLKTELNNLKSAQEEQSKKLDLVVKAQSSSEKRLRKYVAQEVGKVVANEVGKAVAKEVGKATRQILEAILI
ncbi:hypothetical protein Tco_0367046 [Tanacetum coccineum]